MNIPIIGSIIDGIVGLVKAPVEGYVERKKIETQAKAQRKAAILNHASEWELKALEDDSWMRDWLMLLVSIPMVLCFIPYFVDDVKAGFDALRETPEWYRYLVGTVFSFAFARREVSKVMTKRKALKVAEDERKETKSMNDIANQISAGMLKP